MANEKANWVEIETASLNDKLSKLLGTMQADKATAKKSRDAFISAVTPLIRKAAEVADDQDVIIADRFGKVSFAVVDKAAGKGASSGKAKFKLG